MAMVARWGALDDGRARAAVPAPAMRRAASEGRAGRGSGALWIAAAALDGAAAWMLGTAAGAADLAAGACALAVALGGLWWALGRGPACTRRTARAGETAARYYGLRDLGPAPPAPPPLPPAPRAGRFDRGARAAAPPRALSPVERYARVEAEGRAARRDAAAGPLTVDWAAFDAARAAWGRGRDQRAG